jgi:polysaccharide export outer membrane protein
MDKRFFGHPCIIFIIFLTFVIGCGSTNTAKTLSTIDHSTSAAKKTDKLNEAIMLRTGDRGSIDEEYKVGPEDLLEIEAYNVEEIKKTVRVNSQGEIALPLVGVITVKDMTTSQIEKVIVDRLEKYVQETVVTVFVKEYHSQRISVVGAVRNPQSYAVTGQRYLIDMLMIAGGLTEGSGIIAYVIRPSKSNSPNKNTETIVIDLEDLLFNGNLTLNIPVFSGDVISVPKGGVFFVDGSVKDPGVFTMRGKTTILQAITMAKGVTGEAKLSDIRIFRNNDKGGRDTIVVDYEAIKKGDSPDILLVENDIIIVPKSGIKSFFNGFVNSLRGLISFGGVSAGVGM